MDLSSERISSFQTKILSWYELHSRDLPWRKTRDPYWILISEIMAQQTQLSRVVPKYEAWVQRFPTMLDLATAPIAEVLRYWSGLGYNRRALNLQKATQQIVEQYHGFFPQTVEELVKLPGLGKYTASAVACFAFNLQIPVIDTNVRKVISHEFFEGVLPDEKMIEKVAQQVLPEGKAYEWNQALMDYSQLVLKDKKIPVPKQSNFLKSNRYYRGQTVKLLLQVHEISFVDLWSFFRDRNPIQKVHLKSILISMQKDGLIVYKADKVCLP